MRKVGDDFGIGTTKNCFHYIGTWPEQSDRFKSLVTEGVMLSAVDLSIQAEIPSGPVALELSREDNREKVSSLVHYKSSGIVLSYIWL